MYIEEIILDGFKSYGKRMVIGGWDPEFNAITGLNGSGKSNILDAICFVLGLDNLSRIRASALQDLIYKKGQTGISRATVSIVFNNSDETASPVGFQDSKQIVVTRQIMLNGKSKYMINGLNVTQSRIETFFHGIHLNINNPHFLIMQGKITKVLNMKSQEIGMMVEEASGTRMYEDRKERAQMILEKKDRKIEEIGSVLNTLIIPKLERYKVDRQDEFVYQENLKRVQLYEYWTMNCEEMELKRKLEEETNRLKKAEFTHEKNLEQYEECKRRIEDIETEIHETGMGGREIENLAEQGRIIGQRIEALNVKLEILKMTDQRDKEEMEGIQNKLELIGAKNLETEHQHTRSLIKEKKRELEEWKLLYDELCVGVSLGGGMAGYDRLIQNERTRLVEVGMDLEQMEEQKKGLEEEMEANKENASEWKTTVEEMEQRILEEKKKVEKLQLEIGTDVGVETQEQRRRELETDIQRLKHEIQRFNFPSEWQNEGFSKDEVMGMMGSLIRIRKDAQEWAGAIEQCGGGRLYNIVVRDELVGRRMLELGSQRRITLIPLTKIRGKAVSGEKMDRIRSMTTGKVYLGTELIEYDERIRPAVEYGFGNTVLCEDKQLGARLAFDPTIRIRCITKDGDVYDPNGTMSGGKKAESKRVLETFSRMNDLKKEVEAIDAAAEKQKRRGEKKDEMEIRQKSVEVLEAQRMNDAVFRNHERFVRNDEQRQNLKTKIGAMVCERKRIEDRLGYLETEHKQFRHNKEGKMDEISRRIETIRTEILGLEIRYRGLQEIRKGEIMAHGGREMLEKMLEEIKIRKKITGEEYDQTWSMMGEMEAQRESLERKIEEWGRRDQESASKKHNLDSEKQQVNQKMENLFSRLKKEEFEIEQTNTTVNAAMKRLNQIEDIKAANPFNGENVDGCQIDINDRQYRKLKQYLEEYRPREGKHHEIMECIESLEKKRKVLEQQLDTIRGDKAKIFQTCEKLNEYKKEALDKTFAEVNRHFGEIFAQLLPGNWAQLVRDGAGNIEIHVRLGTMWKTNLAELSGGQKSLVGLSFVLAMLKFSPAPFYVLDEIDSALDSSHTQNIGKVFKNQFRNSQFIVVSLKDGLFSHANLVFRTKFVNGVSIVEREVKVPSASQ